MKLFKINDLINKIKKSIYLINNTYSSIKLIFYRYKDSSKFDIIY